MGQKIIIGKIVSAQSTEEAVLHFYQHSLTKISAVIFPSPVIGRIWTQEEKEILSAEPYHSPSAPSFHPTEEWQQVAGDIAEQFVSLSRRFNLSESGRLVQFFNGHEFIQKPHRDKFAVNGWFHQNLSGSGLVCLNPVGHEPVELTVSDDANQIISMEEIEDLINKGKIEMLTVKENHAIVFNHRMAHLSAKEPGFRVTTFG